MASANRLLLEIDQAVRRFRRWRLFWGTKVSLPGFDVHILRLRCGRKLDGRWTGLNCPALGDWGAFSTIQDVARLQAAPVADILVIRKAGHLKGGLKRRLAT